MSQASALILFLTGPEVVWEFDHFIIFSLVFSSASIFSALALDFADCPFKRAKQLLWILPGDILLVG